MDKIEKIIQTIKESRQPIRFQDLGLLLNHFGYTLVRQRGSHVHFRRPQSTPLHFPVNHGQVLRFYGQGILKKLGV